MTGTTPRADTARSPMRARFREQVREDVKAVALTQLARSGASAISVNAIAKQLGVSGPALYRYFASRDDLLAELVVDAYHDLATALAAATDDPDLPAVQRLRALAGAWREFAHAQPHRYQLLFTPPVPDYDAHSAPLVAASRSVMAVALAVMAGIPTIGPDSPSELDLSGPARSHADILDAAGANSTHLRHAITVWTRLHGFVVLELGGNFASMGVDPDALFAEEVDALVGATSPS
jgi:AcrR family transcriptional regulator